MKYILIFQFILLTLTVHSQTESILPRIALDEVFEGKSFETQPYLQLMDNENLSSGIYFLKKGEEDKQEPHKWDEVYYVIAGDAKIQIGDDLYDARSGDLLFVKANQSHRFKDIKSDLTLLVFFSKKEPQ